MQILRLKHDDKYSAGLLRGKSNRGALDTLKSFLRIVTHEGKLNSSQEMLQINLDDQKHGAFAGFAEGQKVARWFSHVGKVWVKSEPGNSAIFSFTLRGEKSL
jgi:hypothetical protein